MANKENKLDSAEAFIAKLRANELPSTQKMFVAAFGAPLPAQTHVTGFDPAGKGSGPKHPEFFWIWREHVRARIPGLLEEETPSRIAPYHILNVFGELPSKGKSGHGGSIQSAMYTMRLNAMVHRHHYFVRPSLLEPTVEFIPDSAYGRRDRRVTMSLGKFLTRYYGEWMEPHHIRDADALFCSQFGADDVKFGSTEDEWMYVYRAQNAVASCMAKNIWELASHCHPLLAYVGMPGIRIAWLEKNKRIIARSIVYEVPEHNIKNYIRVFGDSVLAFKLERLGYRRGSLMGAHLRQIQAINLNDKGRVLPNTFVVPYIDDGSGAGIQNLAVHKDHPGEFIVGRKGHTTHDGLRLSDNCIWYSGTGSNGLTGTHHGTICNTQERTDAAAGPTVECGNCGTQVPAARTEPTGDFHNMRICQACRVGSFRRMYYQGDRNWVSHATPRMTDDTGNHYVDNPPNRMFYRLQTLSGIFYPASEVCRQDYVRQTWDGNLVRTQDVFDFNGRSYHVTEAAKAPRNSVAMFLPAPFTLQGANLFRYQVSADKKGIVMGSEGDVPTGVTFDSLIFDFLLPPDFSAAEGVRDVQQAARVLEERLRDIVVRDTEGAPCSLLLTWINDIARYGQTKPRTRTEATWLSRLYEEARQRCVTAPSRKAA